MKIAGGEIAIMGLWAFGFMVMGALAQAGEGLGSVSPRVWIVGGFVFAISLIVGFIMIRRGEPK